MPPDSLPLFLAAQQAARHGDKRARDEAFATLMAALASPVRLFAQTLLRNWDDADDLGQVTGVALFKCVMDTSGRLHFENEAAFRGFVIKIVRNQAARWWSRRSAAEDADTDDEASPGGPRVGIADLLRNVFDPTNAVDFVDRGDDHRVVREVLTTLPQDMRELLLLAYEQGMTSVEIGQQLGGVGDSTVRCRLSRARQGIRTELEHRYPQLVARYRPRM